MGLIELLERIAQKWQTESDTLAESAELITKTLAQTEFITQGDDEPSLCELDIAFNQLRERFDETHGGFGGAPKFPTPHNLYFLLRYWQRKGNDDAMKMVEHTLEAFSRGGMWDHLGFGFHRYSTDKEWLLPHFEKMLYDQALISLAYIEAYQATGKEQYKEMAVKVFDYVARLLTSPEDVFYSAEDADSEGEEGKFYLWTRAELKRVLGSEDELFCENFNVKKCGNYIDEATGEKTGKNILHRLNKVEDDEDTSQRLEEGRKKLFADRLNRVRPGLDDKVLTDWNGLMIAALARGAFVFNESKYCVLAQRAADFILRKMTDEGGRLLHRYRKGHGGLKANLDDYAYLAWGLLELYEATFEGKYLEKAMTTIDHLIEYFWDEDGGAFFFTPIDGEKLIFRRKETFDGARPSGNSVAYLVLLKASRYSGDYKYSGYAEKLARALAVAVKRMPSVHTFFLCATDFAQGPVTDLLIVGEKGAADTETLLAPLRERFLPNKVLLFRPQSGEVSYLPEFAKAAVPKDGKATAYLCQGKTCGLPETDAEKLAEKLTIKGN